jgi:hypothetical protein
MPNTFPICDGSGRYLIEVDPDDEDPHVLYLIEPLDHFGRLALSGVKRRRESGGSASDNLIASGGARERLE